MAHLTSKKITTFLLIIVTLSLCIYTPSSLVRADSSPLRIVNVQTVCGNGQSCFYFRRGFDVVGFNVTVANDGSSVALGQITLSMVDNCSVPIGDLTSTIFSVNPGQNNRIQVISNVIPSYAFVGTATATVVLEDPSTGPIDFQMVNFYIHSFSSITVTPSINSVTAGNLVSYTANSTDASGNNVDITSWVNWSISSGAGGAWSGNMYSSAKAGSWTVTASLGSLSAASQLNVDHASIATIALSPQNAEILAGQTQAFTTSAYDVYGNAWDVSASTALSIGSGAGGSWNNNSYTAFKTGLWNVTGVLGSLTNSTLLTVNHNSAVSMTISPKISSLTAGSSQSYNVSASDLYGNVWDATNSTVYTIDAGAGGSWLDSVYTSALAGTWHVKATVDGVSDYASLSVTHGPINSLTVLPESTNLTSGCSQVFNATAFDSYGNSWDTTNSAVFSIDPAAAGSWSANNYYTSANLGTWTVTAAYSGLQGIAQLSVFYPLDFYFNGRVNFHDLAYFVVAYINFNQNGVLNPACDLNHDGRINFLDLQLFVTYYVAFGSTM